MNNRLAAWLIAGILPLMASCAASRDLVVIGPVGPGPLTADELAPTGYLKVYTATEDHNDGNVHYFPHTGYTVYSEDGTTVVKNVRNAIGIHDEDPSLVQLPAGTYVVLGEVENGGVVKVAVVIQPGQLTKVDLGSDWKQRTAAGNAADWVRLPNGQIVGWRARATASQSP
ncbi:MAG: hypothetical protein ABSD58_16185 [Verrucomicrobiia bacterium]|jgi:hypothetical protein